MIERRLYVLVSEMLTHILTAFMVIIAVSLPLTLLCPRPVLSRNVGDSWLFWVSESGATELAYGEQRPPAVRDEGATGGLFPLKNCLFSALKRSTEASRSRQSLRLSFRAS